MNDSSKSATATAARMTRTPPARTQSDLPEDVALRVAEAAGVPDNERESFWDLVRFAVRLAWERDRRAIGGNAGAALIGAADAARALHEALDHLEPADREWLERLWTRTPLYKQWLRELPETVFQLVHLLSVAAGRAPPPGPGETSAPDKRGRRKGSVKDVMLLDFVRLLLLATATSKGDLTVEDESNTGTLMDTLQILREYLPVGLVPLAPPAGTLQRIKANIKADHVYYTPLYDIDIFHIPDADWSLP